MPQDASPLISQQPQNARAVPARIVPVPQTVSADLQQTISLPLPDLYRMEPKSREEWTAIIDAVTAIWAEPLPQLRKVLRVRTEPQTVGGVKAFVITPDEIAPENQNRLLVHLHAGGYVGLEGESGTGEGILMAHYG